MPPPQTPGTQGKKLVLATNIYGVKMNQMPVFRYDLTISGIPKNERARIAEFTKRSKDE